MANFYYQNLDLHKHAKGGEKATFFGMTLPAKSGKPDTALLQAFFPENYIVNSGAEHVLKVEMEVTTEGGTKEIVASAEVTMRGNEVIAPPLLLLAKVDLISNKKRTVAVTFLLQAPSTVTLHIGRGVYTAPWTCGALTAQLLDA
jgi:hypothetical protein